MEMRTNTPRQGGGSAMDGGGDAGGGAGEGGKKNRRDERSKSNGGAGSAGGGGMRPVTSMADTSGKSGWKAIGAAIAGGASAGWKNPAEAQQNMVNRAVNGMNSAVSSMNEGGRGGVMGAMASAGAAMATKAMDAGNFVNNAGFSMAGYNDKSVGGSMSHMPAFDEQAAKVDGGDEKTDTQVIDQKKKENDNDEL